jgi:hypothetical protein
MTTSANRKGDELATTWHDALKSVARDRAALSRSDTAFLNAANELGKWIDPGDMNLGEEICIWARVSSGKESLLVVKKTAENSYTVRERAKK